MELYTSLESPLSILCIENTSISADTDAALHY